MERLAHREEQRGGVDLELRFERRIVTDRDVVAGATAVHGGRTRRAGDEAPHLDRHRRLSNVANAFS